MAQIICRDLAIGYEGKTVVQNINLSVKKGDYLCVIGENGAGKSTFMKTLLGLLPPVSGKIEFHDGLKKNEIGYLPQQTEVQKDFPASVREIVLSGCQNHLGFWPFYRTKEKKYAEEMMKKLQITHLSKRCYRELSGGQQQRVLLARALCATRKILLLDEPVSGLDPQMTEEMYRLIEKINREDKITIIMISHDIRGAMEYASHILQIGQEVIFESKENYLRAHTKRSVLGNTGGKKMIEKLIFYMGYPFVRYALIVGVLIALCSSLLGVTLVLKRFSFIGDGLSHVAFGAMAVASVLNITNNMLFILPVTVVCAILLLRTGQNTKIKGDAAIAMISVGALAIGYLLMNVFATGPNLSGDVCTTLFGSTSILTLKIEQVWLCVVLSVVVVMLFIVFYHKIFCVTFDETFAKATGIRADRYNLLIAVITALIIVLAMNLVGSLLISALVIFPALSAMRIFKTFFSVTVCSVVLSVCCAISGMLLSILAGTPVGSTIVAADIVAFLICCMIEKIAGGK